MHNRVVLNLKCLQGNLDEKLASLQAALDVHTAMQEDLVRHQQAHREKVGKAQGFGAAMHRDFELCSLNCSD